MNGTELSFSFMSAKKSIPRTALAMPPPFAQRVRTENGEDKYERVYMYLNDPEMLFGTGISITSATIFRRFAKFLPPAALTRHPGKRNAPRRDRTGPDWNGTEAEPWLKSVP